MDTAVGDNDIAERMNQRLERMCTRSLQAQRQRQELQLLERQVIALAEKLGVELQ